MFIFRNINDNIIGSYVSEIIDTNLANTPTIHINSIILIHHTFNDNF